MEKIFGPLARQTDLIVEELGDEVLVYDENAEWGHCLSPEVARVWRRCDGRTPVEGLEAQLGLDADTVARALDELSGCDLIEMPPSVAEGTTRREAAVKLAKTGATVAAAPMIISLAAPAAAMAVTFNTCNELNQTENPCGGGEPSSGCKSIGCCCCTPANEGGENKFCSDNVENCIRAGSDPTLPGLTCN